jgi:pimeloyl-ACP methyl ester carboxylesterase
MRGLRNLTTTLAAVAFSAYAWASVATVKTLALSGGHTYSYTIAPASYGRGTYLLLHGFPSSSYDWRHTIKDLTAEGLGVIAPDLLGYGATSKPTAVEEYAQEKISGHVVEILQHEGISSVIGVGHDWYVFRHKSKCESILTLTQSRGSGLLSNMWFYHPDLFKSLAFLATPYSPVGPSPLNLTAINTQTQAAFGYPVYGYWNFFNETDAASFIEKHVSLDSRAYERSCFLHGTARVLHIFAISRRRCHLEDRCLPHRFPATLARSRQEVVQAWLHYRRRVGDAR